MIWKYRSDHFMTLYFVFGCLKTTKNDFSVQRWIDTVRVVKFNFPSLSKIIRQINKLIENKKKFVYKIYVRVSDNEIRWGNKLYNQFKPFPWFWHSRHSIIIISTISVRYAHSIYKTHQIPQQKIWINKNMHPFNNTNNQFCNIVHHIIPINSIAETRWSVHHYKLMRQ